MAAIVNHYNGTVQMADSTVLAIIALNKLWIPDVLIDIIKDFLYIDAYTVWRNYSKTNINRSIKDMEFGWYDLAEVYGRQRICHWTKGNVSSTLQFQNLTCITCGEYSNSHDNLDGCCVMEGDTHVDGQILLTDNFTDDGETDREYEDEDDAISYQNDEYDY
jgi:hypothetical protein